MFLIEEYFMSKNFSVGRSPDVLSDMDAIAETARNCLSLHNDEIKSLIKNSFF